MSQERFSRRRLGYLIEAPLLRRRLVMAPALLLSLAASSLAFVLPARYRAAALVRAEWGLGDVAERRSQAVKQRVTETAVLARTLEEATPYAAGGGAPPALAEQVERLRSDLRVRAMAASAFVVEFEHRDPAKAAQVPNVLARLLVEQADDGRRPIARFELLAPATMPAAPESPDPVWYGLAGLLLGLLLGLLVAVVAEHRDRSVKGPEDLDEILPVPLLATLPEVRLRDQRR
jgi:uncharacterized protein involved in exopolysaccharide biosynthesis